MYEPCNNIELVGIANDYLYDAGFTKELYIIEDFENSTNYIEVFFLTTKAIDFIKKDVIISDYKNILEIQKYEYSDGVVSAIITYL